MKKTLVAIAALAVVGAASAQSSVTLYGRIDVSLGTNKTTTAGVTTADPGILMASGAHTGSRWGMKGSEDLGGGLRANFQLEQGFNIDDGTASSARQFHRVAKVGLSGGFGSVDFGRQYDLTDTAYANYDAMGYSGFSAMGAAFNTAGGAGGDTIGRQDNAVIYTTPKMGGLKGTAMWAPGEDKTAAASAGKHYGLMVDYANGPLGLGASWQSNNASGVRASTNFVLGGSFDMGAAKLYGQYQATNNKAANTKDKGWSLGAVVPLGAPSLMVSYARETTKAAGVKTQEGNALGMMVQYPLSKRTYVYGAYRASDRDPVGANNSVKNKKFGLGLVHNF